MTCIHTPPTQHAIHHRCKNFATSERHQHSHQSETPKTGIRAAPHTGNIVCIEHVTISPQRTECCAEQSINLCHLTPQGRFLAHLEASVSGYVLLRHIQYRSNVTPTDVPSSPLWHLRCLSIADATIATHSPMSPSFHHALKRLKHIA
ncbi:CRISPR-associated endonuclease Cas1 [Xylella taiwanensis]|uniref:CRISPR-associated endonuclease Cas1 n=1 Tax=Xylella taiwanensis TaxID=1444770 RepID=UPI003CCDAB8E